MTTFENFTGHLPFHPILICKRRVTIPVLPTDHEIMRHGNALRKVLWKPRQEILIYRALMGSILDDSLFTISISERVVVCLNALQN